jgi:hypothetical protein
MSIRAEYPRKFVHEAPLQETSVPFEINNTSTSNARSTFSRFSGNFVAALPAQSSKRALGCIVALPELVY